MEVVTLRRSSGESMSSIAAVLEIDELSLRKSLKAVFAIENISSNDENSENINFSQNFRSGFFVDMHHTPCCRPNLCTGMNEYFPSPYFSEKAFVK